MISNIEMYDAPADDEDGRMGEDEVALALNNMFGIKEELPRFITLEVVKSQIYSTLNDPLNAPYDLKQIVPIIKPDSVRYLIVMELRPLSSYRDASDYTQLSLISRYEGENE